MAQSFHKMVAQLVVILRGREGFGVDVHLRSTFLFMNMVVDRLSGSFFVFMQVYLFIKLWLSVTVTHNGQKIRPTFQKFHVPIPNADITSVVCVCHFFVWRSIVTLDSYRELA